MLCRKETPEQRKKRLARFMRGFSEVYNSAKRNPSVSGTQPSLNRMMDAAGSDSGKKYRVSAPAVQFGWEPRRDGQAHPDERKDYWLPNRG